MQPVAPHDQRLICCNLLASVGETKSSRLRAFKQRESDPRFILTQNRRRKSCAVLTVHRESGVHQTRDRVTKKLVINIISWLAAAATIILVQDCPFWRINTLKRKKKSPKFHIPARTLRLLVSSDPLIFIGAIA